MSDEIKHGRKHGRTISFRLTDRLHAELQRVADREYNSTSAVVRRLVALGLKREARVDRDAVTVESHA